MAAPVVLTAETKGKQLFRPRSQMSRTPLETALREIPSQRGIPAITEADPLLPTARWTMWPTAPLVLLLFPAVCWLSFLPRDQVKSAQQPDRDKNAAEKDKQPAREPVKPTLPAVGK